MEINHHPHCIVLRCSGRIVHGDGADTLLAAVMSQERSNLQIDLRGVEAIDASGLGALVTLDKWAKQENRSLQFVNPTGLVREAIETTRLDGVLQVAAETSNAAA